MKDLYRKFFRLEIEVRRFFFTSRFKKRLRFAYYEGSMQDLQGAVTTIKNEQLLNLWLFDFLRTHGKISDREYVSMRQDERNRAMRYILRTWGGGYFKLEGSEDNLENVDSSEPDYATICTILQLTNETIASIMSMTWGQFAFLVDGIEWNENAKSKAGQIRNIQKKNGGTDAEALARIKAFEEILLSKKNGARN